MIVTTRENLRELRRSWNLIPWIGLFAGVIVLTVTGHGQSAPTQTFMLLLFLHAFIAVPVQVIHRRGAPQHGAPGRPDRWQVWLPVHVIVAEALLIVGLIAIFSYPAAWQLTAAIIFVPALYSLVAMPLSARGRPIPLEQGEVPNPVSSRA